MFVLFFHYVWNNIVSKVSGIIWLCSRKNELFRKETAMDRLPKKITENEIHCTLHTDYCFPNLFGPEAVCPVYRHPGIH